jgi:hypothetical protein
MTVPRAAGKAALLFFLVALVSATLLVLLVPFPAAAWARHAPTLFFEAENLGHPVLFALLGWLGMRLSGRRIAVIVLLALFGMLTEVLQRYTGRDASAQDLLGNLLGIGLAVALEARPRFGREATLCATVIAALCLLPLLWTLAAYAHRHYAAPVIWREGSMLLDRFVKWRQGELPGLQINEPLRDWRAYEELQIVLRNPGGAAERVHVRVHDWQHNQDYRDRYNRTFMLPPQATTELRISVSEVAAAPAGRRMDLATMSSIIIFQSGDSTRFTPQVEVVRLSRRASPAGGGDQLVPSLP